jgi:hypothetical protein
MEDIAKRILDLIPFWDREKDTEAEALENVINSINNDPLDVIEYLLDYIDEIEA